MSKHIFSKIAKIGEEVRSAEPMRVEFKGIQTTINDLKNHNMNSTLSLVDDGIKSLEKASIDARRKQQQAEMRLDILQTQLKQAADLGIDISNYDGFLTMAKRQVQFASDAAKRIESAIGTAKMAYN
jgi:F420-0:gamma-glutamyl ligase-like protein